MSQQLANDSRPDAGVDSAGGSGTIAPSVPEGAFVEPEPEFIGAFSPILIEFVPKGGTSY